MTTKILCFKLGALGDALMTTPLVRQVRKNFTDAEINYLIGKSSTAALQGNKYLNNIIPFDEDIFLRRNVAQWFRLVRQIRAQKYDIIFIMDRHWIFNLTAKIFGIAQRVGFDRLGKEGLFLTHKVNYGYVVQHDVRAYLSLATVFGLNVNDHDVGMDIFVSAKDIEFAQNFYKEHHLEDKKVIGIVPGGGKNIGQDLPQKVWPVERFIQVIQKLKDPVLLLGGPFDKDKELQIRKVCPTVVSAIGITTLQQSAAIMEKCSIVVSNDSGPMHLAAAMGVQTVAIFGPTNPKVLAPLLPPARVVWSAHEGYDCYGKLLHTDHSCIELVRVEDVLKAVL